jgi:hypothetical protein
MLPNGPNAAGHNGGPNDGGPQGLQQSGPVASRRQEAACMWRLMLGTADVHHVVHAARDRLTHKGWIDCGA